MRARPRSPRVANCSACWTFSSPCPRSIASRWERNVETATSCSSCVPRPFKRQVMDGKVAAVPHPGSVVLVDDVVDVVEVEVTVLELAPAPSETMSSGRIAGFAVSSDVTNDH
jgi:hypothetical protein